MLDEDSTVMLGDFCEEVLRHPYFTTIADEFEKSACHDLLGTTLKDSGMRENIWAEFQGGRAFMQFMASFVAQRNKINEQRAMQEAEDNGAIFEDGNEALSDEDIFNDPF